MRFDELRSHLRESFDERSVLNHWKDDDILSFKFDRSGSLLHGIGSNWKYQFYIEKKNKVLSITGGTLFDEELVDLLKKFLEAIPEVGSYRIEIDGKSSKTVASAVKSGPLSIDKLPTLYHGTSESRWEEIKKNGLVPRFVSGVQAAHTKKTGDPSEDEGQGDLIYFTTEDSLGTARFAARDAARVTKSKPVILKIDPSGVNLKKLKPDEDSGERTWQTSLKRMGSVAYSGKVDPQYIDLFVKI